MNNPAGPDTPAPGSFSFRRVARWEWGVLAAGLIVFFLQSFFSSLPKSPVGDAWTHYAVGEWVLGKPLIPDEPLLWEATMPLTAFHVLSARLRERLTPLFGPPVDPHQAPLSYRIPSLRWARLPSIGMGVLLMALIWLFARCYWGARAAVAALFVAIFEPNLVGHSRFIASDFPATLGFFAGMMALVAYVERPTWPRMLLLVFVVAAAQVTKSTNLVQYPIGLAAVACKGITELRTRLRQPDGGTSRAAVEWMRLGRRVVLLGVAYFAAWVIVLNIAYGGFAPERKAALSTGKTIEEIKYFCKPLYHLRGLVPVAYSQSFAIARYHNTVGHPAYFMGQRSQKGWVAYFPTAIALKTPLPVLLMAGFGLLVLLRERRMTFPIAIPLIASALFLLYFCFFVTVNIGVRYVLPVYPVMVLLAGFGLSRMLPDSFRPWRRNGLRVLLIAFFPLWILREATLIYPHYESYFNQLAGGPYHGWKYLADSNVEWDQDAYIIRDWAARQPRPVAINPGVPTRGLVAVRASLLVGHTPEMARQYAWLRDNFEPSGYLSPGAILFDIPYLHFPQNSRLEVGGPAARHFLGDGWFEGEQWGDEQVRWAAARAELGFSIAARGRPHGVRCRVFAPPAANAAQRTLQLHINRAQVHEWTLPPGEWIELECPWTPRDEEGASFWMTLSSPQTPRIPDDPRPISFAVAFIEVRPGQ